MLTPIRTDARDWKYSTIRRLTYLPTPLADFVPLFVDFNITYIHIYGATQDLEWETV